MGKANLLLPLLLASLGCLDPTEAIVEVTTDALCTDVGGTGVTTGLLGAIETASYDTTTAQCEGGGDIGSIVLLPPDDEKGAKFAFKVVTSLGQSVDDCDAPEYGPNCIVARRAMRFVPQRPFRVPVRMDLACAGVACPQEQTCVGGTCRSATLDPESCDGSLGCDLQPELVPAWQQSFGGVGLQLARHLALGADGTLAVTGDFEGALDLGGEPLTSAGNHDIFVATYSKAGFHRWSVAFGGTGFDQGISLAIDNRADVYLFGSFAGAVDFGGGPLSSDGPSDVALVKLTSFGELRWALRLGGAAGEVPGKVTVDTLDNVYIAGAFTGTAEIAGEQLTSTGGDDVFLASFTSSGQPRWAKAFGGAGNDAANGVAVDREGRIYVGGLFEGQMDVGGPAPLESKGGADAFVASFDVTGEFRWAKAIGAPASDQVLDLAARDQRVVAAGRLSGQASIDGTQLSPNGPDGFVAAFDTEGQLAWSALIGGDQEDRIDNVAIAEDGSVFAGGETSKGPVFDSSPAANSPGITHPFVAAFDPGGAPRWARVFTSSVYANTGGLAAPPDGSAYFAGWFAGELDVGDATLSSSGLQGSDNAFLLHVTPP